MTNAEDVALEGTALGRFAPRAGEAAVMTLLAIADEDNWILAAGSLLTVPGSVAMMSWRRWRERQPNPRGHYDYGGFDLGPQFSISPFPGVRAMRLVVTPESWPALAEGLLVERTISTLEVPVLLRCSGWTSTVFLGGDGTTDANLVVDGAGRPVSAIVASLDAPESATTRDSWEWPLPPGLRPGPVLGAIAPHRRLLRWPWHLLGIDWLGSTDFAPPARFAVGRMHTDAWIVDVRPDFDTGELAVTIGWDEKQIDPLSCSLAYRAEMDGMLLMAREIRITDLPARPDVGSMPTDQPHELPWHRRTLTVAFPRGPRRTDFGLALYAADGRLLDERPVARRVEQVTFAIHVGDGPTAASTSVIGDRRDPPDAAERDEAVEAAVAIEMAAREAAVSRRISTVGELESYLRWRFSCRAGELLILDPHLLSSRREQVLAFLKGLGRPIRALTWSNGQPLMAEPDVQARRLPNEHSLHDRVWIVGETGLLIGTSVNGFLPRPQPSAVSRATTLAELPYADALVWRKRFEGWWAAEGALN